MGIELNNADQKAVAVVLFLGMLYVLTGFAILVASDFVEHRARFYVDQIAKAETEAREGATGMAPSQVVYYRNRLNVNPAYKPLFFLRVTYDIGVPVLGGVWALIELGLRIFR